MRLIGCRLPTSLLECMMVTKAVLGRSAARTSSGHTQHSLSTGRTVTVTRCLASNPGPVEEKKGREKGGYTHGRIQIRRLVRHRRERRGEENKKTGPS